jgi:hypothetical protein
VPHADRRVHNDLLSPNANCRTMLQPLGCDRNIVIRVQLDALRRITIRHQI